MSPHIGLITLGVVDIAKATAFYERLGFVLSKKASEASVSFFKAGGIVLTIWSRGPRKRMLTRTTFGPAMAASLSRRMLPRESEVDAMMAKAETAGPRILKPAAKTFWGGYNGYFADPDSHVWEVAHNPFWSLDENCRVDLPA
jgi:predicted lactoylglutathione lyase